MGGKPNAESVAEYKRRNPERCRAWQKNHNDRKRTWIASIKIERGCIDCGYNARAEALHFDHVRGEKLFNVSSGRSYSRERILAEIEKCDVRCANCHAVKTREHKEHT